MIRTQETRATKTRLLVRNPYFFFSFLFWRPSRHFCGLWLCQAEAPLSPSKFSHLKGTRLCVLHDLQTALGNPFPRQRVLPPPGTPDHLVLLPVRRRHLVDSLQGRPSLEENKKYTHTTKKRNRQPEKQKSVRNETVSQDQTK